MLNTEQIAEFILRPELMRSEDVDTLRELSEKHPYSSVYSLLYLQGVSRFQSVHLDEILPKQAYKLSDRARLFHLLHGAFEGEALIDNEKQNENEEEILALYTETNQEVEESLVTEEIVTEETPETVEEEQTAIETPVAETQQPTSETIYEAEKESEAELQAENEPSVDLKSVETKDIFDFETVAATLAQDYMAQNESDANEPIADQSRVIAATDPEEIEEPYIEPHAVEEKAVIDPIQPDSKRSFTSWLKAGQHKEEPAAAGETEISSGKDEKLQEKAEEQKTEPKSTQQEIIDKFIEKSPTMPKPKTEFYSPSKKAKESLDDERIPVSETLAKIYAAQGNYPKAIHVYHQLSLAFPEKKSLFALQIEELKKKITS